ncbi:MAG: hypothetical protein ABSB41_15700 [Anaerolineales bacterium]|jgi:hypothetical protein
MDVAAFYLIQNYHNVAFDAMARLAGTPPYRLLGEGEPVIGIGRVLMMYTIIFVTLLVLAVLVRFWLKWKENY